VHLDHVREVETRRGIPIVGEGRRAALGVTEDFF